MTLSTVYKFTKFCKSFILNVGECEIIVTKNLQLEEVLDLIELIKLPKNNSTSLQFSRSISLELWQLICDAIKESKVHLITLYGEGWTDNHGTMFTNAICGHPSVFDVEMDGSFQDQTVLALADVFKHPVCRIIRNILVFRGHRLANSAMEVICDIIRLNRTLFFLGMYDECNDGGEVVLDAFSQNYCIEIAGNRFDHLDSIQQLIRRNRQHQKYFHDAVKDNRMEEVTLLLKQKSVSLCALVDGVDGFGYLLDQCTEDMCRLLLKEPIVLLQLNRYHHLYLACAAGSIGKASLLIEHGALLRDVYYDPPYAAINSHSIELIRLLVWLGVDFTMKFGSAELSPMEHMEKTFNSSLLQDAMDIINRGATRKKALILMLCVYKYAKETLFQLLPREINMLILSFVSSIPLLPKPL